jgi:hypothetical protein
MKFTKKIEKELIYSNNTIMSTNRKNTNAWGIPSMETYLTCIMIRKKRH